MKPIDPKAYDLLHQSTLLMSRMESNGIRIDVPYLKGAIGTIQKQITDVTKRIVSDKVYRQWVRRFGDRTTLGSTDQLTKILFDDLGYKPKAFTRTGKYAGDVDSISHIDIPIVKDYILLKKYEKAKTTYLEGILKEVSSDGFLRPSFLLHVARTYRSSCVEPNFQNIPVRDPEIGDLVRKAFIPRKGNCLVENDFSGIEVRVSACYNKDPALIKYIKDKTTDMHRDMACQLFMIPLKEFLANPKHYKNARYCAKNMFVFPEFYGSYYLKCAPNLWENVEKLKLTMSDGTPFREHLKRKGITSLGKCNPKEKPVKGTFEYHVQEVERDFWEKRFRVYAKWKRDFFASYLKEGGFNTFTGFRIEGLYRKNDVTNYPIQGSAFHCLLWTLLQQEKWVRKTKRGALLIGQIHDSGIADVPEREVSDYLAKIKDVVENDLPKHFQWICVPMEIEAEVTPVDGSWNLKKQIPL